MTTAATPAVPPAGRLPPGPAGLPLIGNAWAMSRDMLGLLRRGYAEFGPVFTVWLFRTPMVILIGPEAHRYVMVENPANFLWREALPHLVPLLGEGLLVTDGAKHDWLRRLIQPAFSRSRIDQALGCVLRSAARVSGGWADGATVAITRELKRMTIMVAAEALFGIDRADDQARLTAGFLQLGRYLSFHPRLSHLPIDLPFTPYGRFRRGKAQLDHSLYDLIARRRASGDDQGDVMAMLIRARDEHGRGLSDEQVRDQTLMLLAAGFETTSNALIWTMSLLARSPDVLARARAELQAVLAPAPGSDDPFGLPTADGLRRLKYLEMVAQEAMRLYPPAWAGLRVCREPFTFQGHTIPARTFVMFSQYVTHRLAEYFPDPDAFRPERFDPQTGDRMAPFAYIPFGGGVRLCIGSTFAMMEIKAILAYLLPRYDFELVPGPSINPLALVTLAPKRPVIMVVRRRPASPISP